VANVKVGHFPSGLAVNSVTNKLYVSNVEPTKVFAIPTGVFVIDGKTNSVVQIVRTIRIGVVAEGVAVNPNTDMVYVANPFSNSTSVIDGKTDMVVKIVKVGSGSTGVAIDMARNFIYVTNEKSNTVSIIDGKTNTVVKTIRIV
jgi:YVTN family beta-propeller protein